MVKHKHEKNHKWEIIIGDGNGDDEKIILK